MPVDSVFEKYLSIELDKVQQRLYLNGVRLDAARLATSAPKGEKLRVYADGAFLGLAEVNDENELVSVKRFPT